MSENLKCHNLFVQVFLDLDTDNTGDSNSTSIFFLAENKFTLKEFSLIVITLTPA